MKKVVLSLSLLLASFSLFAQTEDELKKELSEKKASISALEGEAGAIQAKIDALPGWKKGAFGTLGGSIGGFENWYTQASPNNSTGNIGLTVNAFANLNRDKDFWRNSLNINLGWVKFDDEDDPTDDDNFQTATDIFNISSLYGYKLSENFAVSALGEYRTSILEGNFNDPGYLDVGIGGTWTPLKDLIVVIHPLNYNFVFSDGASEYESSLGAKIVADYTRKIGAINFKTNFTTFLSYEDENFHNWQWTNGFGYTLWKKIGVGFDFGLRGNKQEAFNFALDNLSDLGVDPATTDLTLENADNDIQVFWNLGLSYAF